MTRRPERRLAAILAADIVGYSRLVEQDEAATLAAIRDLRTDVIDPLLAGHQGRIVKLMGDGAIVEFASVVDAVACAVAIQKAVAEHQATGLPDRRIVFRIGINLGDVVVEGDDLLGDGVNVAARLEQLCEPGGVLVSGTAYDQLQGKLGLPLEFTGEQRVKNIERPVRAYRVRLDGKAARAIAPSAGSAGDRGRSWRSCLLLAGRRGGHGGGSSTPEPRARPVVAVLPFAVTGRLRSAPQRSSPTVSRPGSWMQLSISRFWIVHGPWGELRLSGPAECCAAPRPGAGRRRSSSNGALQGAGQQLRASVELVDAATGEQLWSERFDRS